MFEDQYERTLKQKKVGDVYLYRVKAGDNIYRIARNFDTKIEWIACMNGLNEQFMIYPNQQLYIPYIIKNITALPDVRQSYELYF